MNLWADIFLGIIAVATLATAIMQVGLLFALARLVRRLIRLADQAEREMGPIFDQLNAIARDASHAAALATAQVERVDALFADLARRVAQSLAGLQFGLGGPAREGRAVMQAFRAVLGAIRQQRDGRRRRGRTDDEDALFI